MDYPYNLSKEEVVRVIENDYHAQADLTNQNFDIYDQLLACETVEESQRKYSPPNPSLPTNEHKKTNVFVNGNGNGGYKPKVNFSSTESKLKAISKLKDCTYKTPQIEIAHLLETLFAGYNTTSGWWLYVAQTWTPQAINRVIIQMIKQHRRGAVTIKNPAAYFTLSIKYRAKRKLPGINGARKLVEKHE